MTVTLGSLLEAVGGEDLVPSVLPARWLPSFGRVEMQRIGNPLVLATRATIQIGRRPSLEGSVGRIIP